MATSYDSGTTFFLVGVEKSADSTDRKNRKTADGRLRQNGHDKHNKK